MEKEAEIEALKEMLRMGADDGDGQNDDENDVSAVTNKYKAKVLQLLTRISLKDVEMRRLETAVELAAGSRIDLRPVGTGNAAVEAAAASVECGGVVGSSMIPFIELLGKSCDSLFASVFTPMEGVDKKLKEYEARINYGNQRVKIVQSLMAR